MNKYQSLMEKAERCIEAARRTEGRMQSIWIKKANQLKSMALELYINNL